MILIFNEKKRFLIVSEKNKYIHYLAQQSVNKFHLICHNVDNNDLIFCKAEQHLYFRHTNQALDIKWTAPKGVVPTGT